MPICNLMTGSGFETEFLGELGMAWLGMVLLFFVIVVARRWLVEEMGIGFSSIGAFVGGYLTYVIVVSLTCAFRWAILGGIVGFIIGAYLIGMFTGGEY